MTVTSSSIQLSEEARGFLKAMASDTRQQILMLFAGLVFASARTFFHGHTFTGNPLACAAALASLRLFETDRVLDRALRTAEVLRPKLAAIAELEHVGDVRQRGQQSTIGRAMLECT